MIVQRRRSRDIGGAGCKTLFMQEVDCQTKFEPTAIHAVVQPENDKGCDKKLNIKTIKTLKPFYGECACIVQSIQWKSEQGIKSG